MNIAKYLLINDEDFQLFSRKKKFVNLSKYLPKNYFCEIFKNKMLFNKLSVLDLVCHFLYKYCYYLYK